MECIPFFPKLLPYWSMLSLLSIVSLSQEFIFSLKKITWVNQDNPIKNENLDFEQSLIVYVQEL